MTNASPIEIHGLEKRYGTFFAVDDVSLDVVKGSFTGLLGPNGAGKSTTIKMMAGLIRPTGGSVHIHGYDVFKNPTEALANVGTVVETPGLYSYLTPRETFKFVGEILGMSSEKIKSETDAILEKVKMTEWADKRVGTFSKGMKQRVVIGQALLNSPDLIILDEPTSGLDPTGMAETRKILKDLKNEIPGLTLLMSSHMLYEVMDLCDRVAVINAGKLIVHDSISELIDKENERHLVIKTASNITPDAVAGIGGMQGVSSVGTPDSNSVEIKFTGDRMAQARLMADLCAMGINAYSLAERGNPLENLYLKLVNRGV